MGCRISNANIKNSRSNGLVKTLIIALAILSLLIISIIVATLLGAADLVPKTIFDVLNQELFGIRNSTLKTSDVYIVWNLRMPRALLAIAVGGGLAICGAAMQAITQNVLADPYILGVSSGASAAASFMFFLGGTFARNSEFTNMAAFIGALVSMCLVYIIGNIGSSGSGTRLVLSGMAISIVFNAFSQFFITMSPPEVVRNITMWTMGSLAEGRWGNIAIPIIVSFMGLIIFMCNARAYNLISLGNETALSMGINVNRVRKITMLTVAFVTGIIVSSCGVIGLVGFVIPHIVRLLIGSDHRKLLPVSYLVGCVFMVWMDMLARFILAPQELPIGIFTSMSAGPFFIILLYRQAKAERG